MWVLQTHIHSAGMQRELWAATFHVSFLLEIAFYWPTGWPLTPQRSLWRNAKSQWNLKSDFHGTMRWHVPCNLLRWVWVCVSTYYGLNESYTKMPMKIRFERFDERHNIDWSIHMHIYSKWIWGSGRTIQKWNRKKKPNYCVACNYTLYQSVTDYSATFPSTQCVLPKSTSIEMCREMVLVDSRSFFYSFSSGSIGTPGNVRAAQLLVLLNFPIDHIHRNGCGGKNKTNAKGKYDDSWNVPSISMTNKYQQRALHVTVSSKVWN